MIIVSCRKKYISTRALSRRLQLREYPDPTQPDLFSPFDLADLKAIAKNEHVCILVHGFKHPLPYVLNTYAELQARMEQSGVIGPKGYGLVVGFTWPGWNSAPGFIVARVTANHAAKHLRRLINHLRPVTLSIDVQTHSLGARVALGALLKPRTIFIDNLLLTAPAVDHTILEPARAFHGSLDGCNRCLVYHSRKDKTLRKAYPIGDAVDGIQPALGLNGPRSRTVTREKCPNVYVVNCSEYVPEHSGYRHADAYFRHWRHLLSGDALKRYEKL